MNFYEVFSLEIMYRCGTRVCKGVRWKQSTQNYECQLMRNVCNIRRQLFNETYRSKGFNKSRRRERGKERIIQSVHISERNVQMCLCDYCLMPTFAPTFIYDNSACIKDKGVSFAVSRLKTHLHRYYLENNSNDGYILLFDVKNFFGSIDHKKLLDATKKKIEDQRLYNLFAYFINCFEGDKGLGLGSQVSQVSSAIFMNQFDHYFKDYLRIKYYARYMDDGYIICRSKAKLKQLKEEIIQFFYSLGLTPNINKTQICKLSSGFTYLKRRFILHENGKIVVKPNKANILRYKRRFSKLVKKYRNNEVKFSKVLDLNRNFKGYLKEFNYYDRYTKTIKGAEDICLLLNKKSQT